MAVPVWNEEVMGLDGGSLILNGRGEVVRIGQEPAADSGRRTSRYTVTRRRFAFYGDFK